MKIGDRYVVLRDSWDLKRGRKQCCVQSVRMGIIAMLDLIQNTLMHLGESQGPTCLNTMLCYQKMILKEMYEEV